MDKTVKALLPITFIIMVIALLFLVSDFIQSGKRDEEYADNIKRANDKITELELGIANSEEVARILREAADAAKLNADNRIAELEKSEKLRKARYARELRELRAEIATMPPDEIVTETQAELGRQDVYKLPDGVKFSFEASKANLTILVEFSLVKRDRDAIKASLDICNLAVIDYKSAIVGFEAVIVSKNETIFNMSEIITEERGKFSLCEKDKKHMQWKGFKKGGAIGGVIGFILGLVFGGK